VVTAIAVVFAVIGVNDHIYAGVSAQVAVGAGWLLIAIVDVSLFKIASEPALMTARMASLPNLRGRFDILQTPQRGRERWSINQHSTIT
jgi:hypothetical protein